MKPGTRVKKVRGEVGIGTTGVVVGDSPESVQKSSPGWTMSVRIDGPWVSNYGWNHPSGSIAYCRPYDWEPIIPSGHQPSTFTMDSLLESLAEQSVPSDPVSTP